MEGNVMMICQNCKGIGADLIGKIAICGDPIRTDEDAINFSLAHEQGCHAVANEGIGDAVLF